MVEGPRSEAPRVVCLCGSTRFKAQFLVAAELEALAGRIVLMPGVFSKSDGKALSPQEVEGLTRLHRQRIAMADQVLVIDPKGYVGDATTAEIDFARQLGKTVLFWSQRPDADATVVPIDPVEALAESHRAQRLVMSQTPTLDVPAEVKELRCALIEEEAAEFRAALDAHDIVEVADAIADLLYVVYGAALTFGIPVREIFTEIHRSNMTKLDDDGNPQFRADGKVLKGPTFSPPKLRPILEAAAKRVAEAGA